jgi:trk system potassium uptake protein TrkH
MMIGASPQSTGGGVKTTVFARLFLRVDDLEKSRRGNVFFFSQSFRIAFFLVGCYIVLALAGGFLIALIDGITPVDSIFESFSALGTVGLSRDLTPRLSDGSKLIVMLLMFSGRVLFPSFVAWIVRSRRPDAGDADWS